MSTPTVTDRQRASNLRKKMLAGEELNEGDAAFLQGYEQNHPGKAGPDWGASQAKKSRVTYTEEHDETAAMGTGASASAALAHAAVAREEGRRQDAIMDRSIRALEAAVTTYQKITMAMLAERQADAIVQRSLLESVRTHFLERTEAEAEILRRDAEADAAEAAAVNAPSQNATEQAIFQALLRQGIGNPAKSTARARKSGEEPTNVDSGDDPDPFD